MTDFISREAVLEILRTPTSVDTFPDMIARVEALEGCGVRVKALEWEKAALVADSDLIVRTAQSAFGRYSARQLARWADDRDQSLLFSWTIYWNGSGHLDCADVFQTLEAAKAAAQADYEARILAALEPVAQPETPIPGQKAWIRQWRNRPRRPVHQRSGGCAGRDGEG